MTGLTTPTCEKTIVTGGAGFIGSHLCESLLERGSTVVCIDDLSSGDRRNVERLAGNPRFAFICGDVCDADVFEQAGPVSRIYNLACPASPPFYQTDPIHTMRTCVEGAINVLEHAKRCGARVLQTSTSEVYGDPAEHPQTEGYRGNVNCTGPRACYDEGKRAAESLFFDYHRVHGVDIRVVRIFNTYGPRMRPDDGRVVSNFICQALAGDDLTVYGDGSQTRSLCYVADLVDGLVRMMENDGFIGPVNLGNPCELTVLELAQRVIELTGSSSQVAFKELPIDDPTRRNPDVSRALEKLGWAPSTPLDEGLMKTVEYMREAV